MSKEDFMREIISEFGGTFSGKGRVYESEHRVFELDLLRLENKHLNDVGVYCKDGDLFPKFQHKAPANRNRKVYMSVSEFMGHLREKKEFL